MCLFSCGGEYDGRNSQYAANFGEKYGRVNVFADTAGRIGPTSVTTRGPECETYNHLTSFENVLLISIFVTMPPPRPDMVMTLNNSCYRPCDT